MPRLAVLLKPMTLRIRPQNRVPEGLGQNRHSRQRTRWFVALATTCVARLARIRFWPQTRLMEDSEIGSNRFHCVIHERSPPAVAFVFAINASAHVLTHIADMPADPSLTRQDIVRLIDAFYDKVQADAVLGPIFNPAVHDWSEHKATLVQFWASVALGSREYRGNPMAAHRPHPIVDAHFGHWLALWRTTAHEVMQAEHAERMYAYAQRIAQSLRYGLGLDHTRPPDAARTRPPRDI